MATELCYCSIKFEGDYNKLIEILNDKLDHNETKKLNQEKILVSLPWHAYEDLTFLKTFMESEGLKIRNVIIITFLNINNILHSIQIDEITKEEYLKYDKECSFEIIDKITATTSITSEALKSQQLNREKSSSNDDEIDITTSIILGDNGETSSINNESNGNKTGTDGNKNGENCNSCNAVNSINERLNTIIKILFEKQTSLKSLAALSKDDPINYMMNAKFLVPFFLGSLLVIFVNNL